MEEPRDDDQSRADEGPGSAAQDRPQQIPVATGSEQYSMSHMRFTSEECKAENDTVAC